jgi:hypothetical protein
MINRGKGTETVKTNTKISENKIEEYVLFKGRRCKS